MADTKSKELLDEARQVWDGYDFDQLWRVAWVNIPEIYKSTRPFPEDKGIQDLIETWLVDAFPQDRRQLVGAALLCGDLQNEREFFRDRWEKIRFAKVHGYDLSPANLKAIKGLDFEFESHVVDCNNLFLEKESLHFIVGHHGIHHVYNVGNLFFQCNQALREGGLMYVEEYVGPRYLQLPRTNYWIARLLLVCLFSKRERTTHEGRLKGKWISYPPGALDPSEACKSEAIEPEMLDHFQVLHILRYGGLCYPVFEGLGMNFPKPSWRFKFVIYLERALQHLRIIKPLFVQAVLRKKKVW